MFLRNLKIVQRLNQGPRYKAEVKYTIPEFRGLYQYFVMNLSKEFYRDRVTWGIIVPLENAFIQGL